MAKRGFIANDALSDITATREPTKLICSKYKRMKIGS